MFTIEPMEPVDVFNSRMVLSSAEKADAYPHITAAHNRMQSSLNGICFYYISNKRKCKHDLKKNIKNIPKPGFTIDRKKNILYNNK